MSVKREAQLVLEYAGIIALTVVVLITMFVYLNRGLQGKIEADLVYSFNQMQFAGTAEAKGSAFETESRHMEKETGSVSLEFGQFMYLGSLTINKSDRQEKIKFR